LKAFKPLFSANFRLLVLLGLGLLLGRVARAQILDDSTKVRYGPRTTRVVLEVEALRDSTAGTPLDTTLTRAAQSRFWLYDSTFQQDLGTMGSASRPLLFVPNLQLGARLGRTAFDRYFRNAANTPHYDSRSPYSFFKVVQSSSGEQIFEFTYSRSFKKNFSIGASYERIASNKILGAVSSRDGLVEHNGLLFFGRFQTDDERYHLLFSFVGGRHRAIEQGGIQPFRAERRPRDLFKYEKQRVYLTTAQNEDDRDQFHFLQTYRLLGRGLTLYHVFDAQRQYNSYFDQALTTDTTGGRLFYYPRNHTNTNTFATLDRAEYRQVENTLGILGRTAAVEYRLYARRRDASLSSSTLDSASNARALNLTPAFSPLNYGQTFLGGTAAFRYRIYAIEAAGEYKLLNEYWLRASVRTGPLSAELLRTSYVPTLTLQRFAGNHYAWNNLNGKNNSTFDNTTTDQLTVRLRQRLPFAADHSIEISGALANISKLVFYNASAEPEQLAGARQLLIGAVRYRVRLGQIVFDNQATYTQGGNDVGLRIPALVAESRTYYQRRLFKNAIAAQTGVEVYYQSTFRGYDYSPSTQQFYVQDHFTIRNYAVVNAFFTADIKTVDIFLKASYLNEGIFYGGYFTTPYYTGYPRRFTLGIKWNFYN